MRLLIWQRRKIVINTSKMFLFEAVCRIVSSMKYCYSSKREAFAMTLLRKCFEFIGKVDV